MCSVRCGRSLCLRLQRNAATARLSNYATRKFLKTGFDFPNCLLGKRNYFGWCAEETPSPKSVILGWEFGSSCSVGGLWLSWTSTFVSSCCLVVGVCSVVAVSRSLVSSFIVIGGGMKNLKESIRRWAFVFDFPPTSCRAGDGLHCFIATKWLSSNTAPCLLSTFPYLGHKMETFLPKNKLCFCRGARRHVQFATVLHQHHDIAMLNKEPHQQGNPCQSRHSRIQWRVVFCLRLIVSKNCTKWLTNMPNILLRNKYYVYYLHGYRAAMPEHILANSWDYIIMLYSIVQFYGDVFELIFWSFFFNLRNNGTAMAVLAAPLPAALLEWPLITSFTSPMIMSLVLVLSACHVYTMNFPTKVLVLWWRYAISCDSWPGSWECWCMHHSWAVARVQQRQCDSRQKLPQSADRAGMGRRVAWHHQRLLHDICLSGIEAVTR